MHHLFGQQLLDFGILSLKGLQLPRIRRFHPAIPEPPLLKGRVAHAMLAAQMHRPKPSLMLFLDSNDLFFAETASLHRLSPQLENSLTLNTGYFTGAGNG
jgi:hypothetical protein